MKSDFQFTVLRDQQEKKGYWTFPANENCLGTKVAHLKTADYAIENHEGFFLVERKASTGEFAMNVNEGRFVRELERMESCEHPFLVAEFAYDDLSIFPVNSGIPRHLWPSLKVTSKYLRKCWHAYELKYKTKLVAAGPDAEAYVAGLIKRVAEWLQK